MAAEGAQEVDDFGLPIRKNVSPPADKEENVPCDDDKPNVGSKEKAEEVAKAPPETSATTEIKASAPTSTEDETKQPDPKPELQTLGSATKPGTAPASNSDNAGVQNPSSTPTPERTVTTEVQEVSDVTTPKPPQSQTEGENPPKEEQKEATPTLQAKPEIKPQKSHDGGFVVYKQQAPYVLPDSKKEGKDAPRSKHSQKLSEPNTNHEVSGFSHQALTAPKEEPKEDTDDGWQTMPAYAPYDLYDDNNKLIAKEHNPDEDETYGYAGLGGAGKGYTRVLDDEDAESETSMDDNTRYLFKDVKKTTSMTDLNEDGRDAMSQLQATKDLLTEGQRIAYVGITRLELAQMIKAAESLEPMRKVKKDIQLAAEAMQMWSQKTMVRLYAHMEISPAEQIMIEQLAAHGVVPQDLTPTLMQNARVKNPMAAEGTSLGSPSLLSEASSRPSTARSSAHEEAAAEPPPPYETHEGEELPEVKTPSQLPNTNSLDIDLRWTVLCDLFLVLIADGIYDARSRVLLERVGKDLEVPWIDMCRFEKRVTDALEMQQEADQENWNEDEHLENRRKLALKRRYVMMGLATVGGGLVIGLSAGLLAPLIGAGLAAGFTTIGVGGTSSFLAGAGGAAVITSGAAASGSFMGGKAAGRRTGAVKTFEYRPLHNNKRVSLIVTVSGWMTSTNDDVRLPFSTVDPIMGDLYSILWEPEMLTSMGDTINILATEALTQGLQQVLGSTILISLMAALQLPVVLSKLTYLIDNPWAVSLDRAWSAGLILADSLIDRNLGSRPITLVGYSLGSRVIFACLLELAKRGAYGVVQNVYIFGSPIVVKKEEFLKARTVVAGRFVNGYNRTDWILGYLFRLTNGGIRRVAGLGTVDGIPGVENIDCTDFVVGHMEYRTAMPKLLRECGWTVESDEFGEIEDPDPEKHSERQRELINEIEEARKELEREGQEASNKKKSRWSIFGRKNKGQRQEWELYDDKKGPASKAESQGGDVLFDVDAIRAEISRDEELQVKELASTLPPMKLDVASTSSPTTAATTNPRDSLRTAHSDQGSTSTSSWRRPSFEQQHSAGFGATHYHEDDHVRMTFDSPFREPDHKPYSPPAAVRPQSNQSSAPSERPGFKSSQTVPNLPGSNPWADDDDDDDFGKEKEVSMTFA
ncbi:hypothetical protein F4780DRAFT_751549 [Xylariomycetidae sp. FL0641]|nr:hypothetical protein F4780DRAFT_751549 [Xylariomycetidae sp. FL0641]